MRIAGYARIEDAYGRDDFMAYLHEKILRACEA